MTKPLTVVLVPGIRWTGCDNNWCRHAGDWIYRNIPGAEVITFPYRSTALFRRRRMRLWTRELRGLLNALHLQSRRIIVIAHSNGCELTARVMEHPGDLVIDSAVMIQSAAESDWRRNGLADSMLHGSLKSALVFASRNDWVLKWLAGISRIGRIVGLGYGLMGYQGAVNVTPALRHRVTNYWHDGGHGAPVGPDNIAETMEAICTVLGDMVRREVIEPI